MAPKNSQALKKIFFDRIYKGHTYKCSQDTHTEKLNKYNNPQVLTPVTPIPFPVDSQNPKNNPPKRQLWLR